MKLLTCLALLSMGCEGTNECRKLDNGNELCGPTSVEVPLEPDSPSPIIIAKLNGRAIRVMIDTGAEAPIISSSWLNTTDDQWVRTHELCFADLCMKNEQVFAKDTEFSKGDESAINGFIGMRTLKHFTIEFDHDQALRFIQGGNSCSGETNDLTIGPHGTPFVDINIDGQVFPGVTVDSGSAYTVLSKTTVGLLDTYVTATSQPADLCTVNGCKTGVANTSSVMSYCVFGSCQTDVAVKYPVFDGVGSSFLFLQHTSFDFPRSTLTSCNQ